MLLSRENFEYMLRNLAQFGPYQDVPEETVRAFDAEISRHFDPVELDDRRGVNEQEFADLCEALNLPRIPFDLMVQRLGDAARTDHTQQSAAFDPTVAIPSMSEPQPQPQFQPDPPPSSDEGMVMETQPPRRRRVRQNPVVEFVDGLSLGQIGLLLLGLFFVVAIIAGLARPAPTASGSQDPSGWMRPNADTPRIAPKEKP